MRLALPLKLPRVSGAQAVQALERLGFTRVRQHGSRVTLKRSTPCGEVFASRREEAEFWDTHDITEFEDELEPVQVRFSKHLSKGITIRLQPETLARLRRLAHEQGIGPTTLARMWLLERLREVEQQRPA